MRSDSEAEKPQAVLLYVEEMLVELARMAEGVGRDVLSLRILSVAVDARREAAAMGIRSWLPGHPEEAPPGLQD